MSQSNEKTRNLWVNVMLAAACATILLSIGMAVPPYLGISYFNFLMYGAPSFPADISAEGIRYLTFAYSLIGCITIGWMVVMIYLANGPIRRGDDAAWKAATLSMVIWFVTDSTASVALGYWQNAVSNVSLAVFFAVPLFMLRPGRSVR